MRLWDSMMAEDCNTAFKEWLAAYNCHLNEVASARESSRPDDSDPHRPTKLDAGAAEKEH